MIVDRLLGGTMAVMGKRVSRRQVLQRVAVAGSAVAVAPITFATRPVDPLTIIRCSNCSAGAACCDGWTTFCCVINDGQNMCPPTTFMAGWWKCTNYTGSRLCASEGVRYIVDCNRTPGTVCTQGCHCAKQSCGNRGTCCNLFRYGQCNVEVVGTTEVVCRMITCVNPSTLFINCNSTLFIDDVTCTHEASCL